jgi:hypothetical protein
MSDKMIYSKTGLETDRRTVRISHSTAKQLDVVLVMWVFIQNVFGNGPFAS